MIVKILHGGFIFQSIKNITAVEIAAIGGGYMTIGDHMLAVSKLNFSLPDFSDNSLLGKPALYPIGICGGLKIVTCEIDETIGFRIVK